jgi:peptide/nickel transport system substrate-binding protein
LREKNTEDIKLEEAHNLAKDSIIMYNIIVKLFGLAVVLTLSFSQQKQLNLAISSNPSRINPILATDSTSSMLSDKIFSSLFKYDKDAKIIADLALSYKFEDNKNLIIKIKQNIKWQDGVEFNIDDVIFTYQKIMDKEVFTPLVSSFSTIDKIIKLDNYSMRVIYKKPYFKALHIWMVGILPKHIFKDENIMDSKYNKKPIGTKYYKLKELSNSSSLKLVVNNLYHDKIPNLETINYKFLPDDSTKLLMLKSQKIDMLSITPMQMAKQIDQNDKKRFNFFTSVSYSYTYMGFNLKNSLFKNPEIREAISLAIDKQEIVDILFFGYGSVCNGPFLPGSFAYNPKVKQNPYNPKKAIKLLAKNGYNSKNRLSFTLKTNINNTTRLYSAQIIQQQLRRVGIDMKIKAMEWQAFLNTVVHPRNYEVIMLGWGLSLMPDAKSIWHSSSDFSGGFNLVGYSNKRVDLLIIEAEETLDRKKLSKIYQEIYRLIVKDNPYIFLYIPDSIVAVNKQIKGVTDSIIGIEHNMQNWIKE